MPHLSPVIVLERSQRVDRLLQRVFAFGITGNLHDDELVARFRHALRSELQSGQELDEDGGDEYCREDKQENVLRSTSSRDAKVGLADQNCLSSECVSNERAR